jgi:tetratricopeptide (TPR) repeat protein
MNFKSSKVLSVGAGLLLVACGGGGGGAAGGTVTAANAARGSGGEVIRSGSGQAVSITANQNFERGTTAFRAHDDANSGRGDWNEAACNEVAGIFEAAANAQPNGAFPEAWFNRAMVFDRCNLRDRERESLERAIRAARGNKYCRAQAQLGVLQVRAGQTEPALATFQRAITDDANCVEAYTNAAAILRERNRPAPAADQPGDRQQAVNYIRQALARDDRHIPALNQLALVYLQDAGDDPRSQRLFLAGIVCAQAVQVVSQHSAEIPAEIRSYVADVYNTWGLVNIKIGQIIRALENFRRASTLNPNLFEAFVNYGTINLNFRGYEEARGAFARAVELRPNDYDSHIGLGVALRGLGQIQPAQAEYERARTLDQNRPDAFYNLALLNMSYMGNQVADLERARGLFQQFQTKANGSGNPGRYANELSRTARHLRNIQDTINALQAAAALNAASGGQTGATPAAGGTTPAAGGTTPAAGGTTPAAGGTTPAAGGTTPAAGGATPAAGGTTPAAGGATPAAGGAAPAASGGAR